MSFVLETTVRAVRKQHRCCACPTLIEIGSPGVRWKGMTDGDFHSVIYHPECREAEVALNKLHGLFADEWYPLNDLDLDDHEWLLAEYPVVAARFGMTADSIREAMDERHRCRMAFARSRA